MTNYDASSGPVVVAASGSTIPYCTNYCMYLYNNVRILHLYLIISSSSPYLPNLCTQMLVKSHGSRPPQPSPASLTRNPYSLWSFVPWTCWPTRYAALFGYRHPSTTSHVIDWHLARLTRLSTTRVSCLRICTQIASITSQIDSGTASL